MHWGGKLVASDRRNPCEVSKPPPSPTACSRSLAVKSALTKPYVLSSRMFGMQDCDPEPVTVSKGEVPQTRLGSVGVNLF